MGIGYYLKNNQEPYVNPNTGKVDVRSPTPAGSDQWSAPTATPQQAAQISYAVAHTPAQVQQQQIAEQQVRNASMGDSQSEIDRRRAYDLAHAQIIGVTTTPGPMPVQAPFSETPAGRMAAQQSNHDAETLARYNESGGGQTFFTKAVKSGGEAATGFLDATIPKTDIPGISGIRSGIVGLPMIPTATIEAAQFWFMPTTRETPPEIKRIQMETAIGDFSKSVNTPEKALNTGAAIGTQFLVGAAVGGAIGRGYSAYKTTGLTDIPIEQIGYDSPAGYPKNPTPTRLDLLKKSFDTNTLVPEPVEMSTGKPAPYTFTGESPARLPTDIPGQKVVWTGWEKSPVNKVTEGTRFTLGEGSSELPGASAAPVAEAYFAKVGGQMPNVIGIDINPFKSPNIMHTVVEDVKIAPRGLQNEAAAREFFYSQKPEPGTAYLFGIKAEYEANIPVGTELRFYKPRYRTTLGGIKIGEHRILGTRVPIYEARTTGVRIMGETRIKPVELQVSTSSLKSKPIFNVAYSGMPSYSISHPLSASPFVRETSSPISRESVVSEVSRIAPSSHVSSRYISSEIPRSSSSRRTSTTSPPPSSRPPSSSRPPGSYTPPYSKPPSYTPPRSTYRPPPYTPIYTPPRTGVTGGSRLPIPISASLRGSSSRGAGWGVWKGTTRTNRVVGLIQFFGRAMKKRKP